VAGGKGEGTVYNGNESAAGRHGKATINSMADASNDSLGLDLSQNGSFKIDGQRLYNLAMHNDYNVHSIVIDVKGKGFQLYTFTFG
jgi:hypothetical protein